MGINTGFAGPGIYSIILEDCIVGEGDFSTETAEIMGVAICFVFVTGSYHRISVYSPVMGLVLENAISPHISSLTVDILSQITIHIMRYIS